MLGQLLAAGEPLSVGQLVALLAAELGDEAVDATRVSDMLRYQTRIERVRRVARGRYEVVPDALSTSMAWRCLNWRREQDRAHQRWLQQRAS